MRGVTEGSWRRRASQAGSAIVPALLVECASNLWITPASVNPPRIACMFRSATTMERCHYQATPYRCKIVTYSGLLHQS